MADGDTLAYLGASGIVLGDVDADGVDWRWKGDEPWGNSPAPREQVGELAHAHGAWDATKLYGTVTRALSGVAQCTDHTTLHRAKERLKAAVSVLPFTLRIVEPGYDRQALVRRGGEVIWTETDPGSADWSLSLFQADPMVYSTVEHSETTGLATGGDDGLLSATNAGTEVAWPVFRVDGPVPDFTLTHQAGGGSLTVDNPAGQTLAAGEHMIVDTRRRKVLLNGLTSRRSWMYGSWFGLGAAGTTVVGFSASALNSTARCTATFRSTWL